MKKRTFVPFYDKQCQRVEQAAATAVKQASRFPAHAKELLAKAEGLRACVKKRIAVKRAAREKRA